MRTIPPGFKDAKITDLQVCWEVVRRDGAVIRGTEADIDITITDDSRGLAGTYLKTTGITGSDIRSTDDLSVDNLEVKGALAPPTAGDSSSSALSLLELSGDDIEAGLYDNAEITTFQVNSLDVDAYQHILRTGWMGNIRRTAEGAYTTEMRGLTQALSQGIVKTYGVGCQWELGSTPSTTPPGLCRVDLTPFITSGAVTVAESRREFQVGVGEIVAPLSNVPGGKITWTSGLNVGYSMEIKAFLSLDVTLFLPMPNDIQVGDTFDFQPGCDKQRSTCIDSYNNIDNFGGWGTFVPGQSEILKVGKR